MRGHHQLKFSRPHIHCSRKDTRVVIGIERGKSGIHTAVDQHAVCQNVLRLHRTAMVAERTKPDVGYILQAQGVRGDGHCGSEHTMVGTENCARHVTGSSGLEIGCHHRICNVQMRRRVVNENPAARAETIVIGVRQVGRDSAVVEVERVADVNIDSATIA